MIKHQQNSITGRLIVVSNRLPIVITKKDGKPHIVPGSGGLITAMAPLLKKHKGIWIGWIGTHDFSEDEIAKALHEFEKEAGFKLVSVSLTKEEIADYYEGFSNEIIWPLFHDLHAFCNFKPSYWRSYQNVNIKFAEKIKSIAKNLDFIWIHDYHLMLVGKYLKQNYFNYKLSFFLHIPFAPIDIFLKIPWRFEILRALLDFDSLGFQTQRDMRNFIYNAKALLKDAIFRGSGNKTLCLTDSTVTKVGVYPISIDFDEFEEKAKSPEVEKEVQSIRQSLPGRKLVFSVDRLDYTKGIPYRLEAIANFLKSFPEFHRKVNFIQVIVPSRTDIQGYIDLKEKIDKAVSQINSEYTSPGWIPIHYMFHSLTPVQLLGFYRASDVALVTPIKDGMNLVCKEYAAANIEEKGALVLSEFAGAACQLKEAFLINPYDVEGTSRSIYEALTLSEEKRHSRMKKLRQKIRKENIYFWLNSILESSGEHPISGVPDEYIPEECQQFNE